MAKTGSPLPVGAALCSLGALAISIAPLVGIRAGQGGRVRRARGIRRQVFRHDHGRLRRWRGRDRRDGRREFFRFIARRIGDDGGVPDVGWASGAL